LTKGLVRCGLRGGNPGTAREKTSKPNFGWGQSGGGAVVTGWKKDGRSGRAAFVNAKKGSLGEEREMEKN